MKIIFIDINGVLSLQKDIKNLIDYNKNKELFFEDLYNVKSMINFRKIVIYTNALIVPINKMELLKLKKFRATLALYEIDTYFYKNLENFNNLYNQIDALVAKINCTNYLILNNENSINIESKKIEKYHLQIDSNIGITKKIADEAIKRLTFNFNKK